MNIPIRCPQCEGLARFIRFPFAWITVCHFCALAQVKYDTLRISQ